MTTYIEEEEDDAYSQCLADAMSSDLYTIYETYPPRPIYERSYTEQEYLGAWISGLSFGLIVGIFIGYKFGGKK